MTLGRSFLLWLLGVLVVTLVLVSALVLWHERRILEDELATRADLLAQILAIAAADGGSPEYLTIFSMADVRAGEVRDANGQLVWRFGPPAAEVEALDTSLMRVELSVAACRAMGKRSTSCCWFRGRACEPTWRLRRRACSPASVSP